MARRAHRDRRVFVRVQCEDFAIRIAHVVDIRLSCLRTATKTTKTILARLERDDLAVVFYTRFQLLPRARAIAGHHKLVVASEHQFHRRLCLLRETARDHDLESESKL